MPGFSKREDLYCDQNIQMSIMLLQCRVALVSEEIVYLLHCRGLPNPALHPSGL
jgi:hypothetical protein